MNIFKILFRREKRRSGHIAFDVLCFGKKTDIYRLTKNVEFEKDLIGNVCRNCGEYIEFDLKGNSKSINMQRHKITVYSEVYWKEVRL